MGIVGCSGEMGREQWRGWGRLDKSGRQPGQRVGILGQKGLELGDVGGRGLVRQMGWEWGGEVR